MTRLNASNKMGLTGKSLIVTQKEAEFNLVLTHTHPFASTSNHFIKSTLINFFRDVTFNML